MPGTSISPTSIPGLLGILVLITTVLFALMAGWNLLPRPDWLYRVLFPRLSREVVSRESEL